MIYRGDYPYSRDECATIIQGVHARLPWATVVTGNVAHDDSDCLTVYLGTTAPVYTVGVLDMVKVNAAPDPMGYIKGFCDTMLVPHVAGVNVKNHGLNPDPAYGVMTIKKAGKNDKLF